MVIDCFLLCILYVYGAQTFTLPTLCSAYFIFDVAMSLYYITKIYFDVILQLGKIHHVLHNIVYT